MAFRHPEDQNGQGGTIRRRRRREVPAWGLRPKRTFGTCGQKTGTNLVKRGGGRGVCFCKTTRVDRFPKEKKKRKPVIKTKELGPPFACGANN